MSPGSQIEFTRGFVLKGVKTTIDGKTVTPENLDDFTHEEVLRAVFHGITRKDKAA